MEPFASRSIPSAVRGKVIARDGRICRRCGRDVVSFEQGAPYRADAMHLDHVVPWSEGGPHTVENLIVCCADCNLRRTKPKHPIRSTEGVQVEYRHGTYYWPDGYVPPVVASGQRAMVPLVSLVNDWHTSVAQAVRKVARGEMAATSGSDPIYIEPVLAPAKPRTRRRPSPSGLEGRYL